jgi:hypothetical protein
LHSANVIAVGYVKCECSATQNYNFSNFNGVNLSPSHEGGGGGIGMLRVFLNRVLRKIFGPKRDVVRGGRIKCVLRILAL